MNGRPDLRGAQRCLDNPFAGDAPTAFTAGGCDGRPSTAVGHLERNCDSYERHITLLRQGFGISKVRGHLTELSDAEVVRSEYGHREGAFR